MTAAEFAVFATLVAVVVGVWVTLFYLLPLIARARFEYRATVLRDECLDAVFDGRLPRTTPVESFLARASMMAAHPNAFTLTMALAVQLAMTDLGCDEPQRPTYASLKPEERKLLHQLDDRLHHALGERLVRGSSFGWLLWLNSMLRRLVGKRHSKAVSGTSPQQLARAYSAISEKVQLEGHKLASLSQ